jgi:long-chain acyl-CoA synthetase
LATTVPTRAEAISALSAAGSDFELVAETINGLPCRVFRNAHSTLRELYADARDRFGDLAYLGYEGDLLSYNDAWRQSAQIANLLVEEMGVGKGDRVAIGMRNFPEWVTAFHAITGVGAIAVALNSLWSGEELDYALELTGAKVAVLDRERLERLRDRLDELDLQVLSVRCPETAGGRVRDLQQAMAGQPGDRMPAMAPAPDDDALIIFTSGSTGHPKGAVSSHRAVIHALKSWDFDQLIGHWRLGRSKPREPDDVQFKFLLATPLFHVAGSHVTMLQALLHGRLIYLMYRWDVDQALDIIEQEQITHFIAVPAVTGDLVKAAAGTDRSLASLVAVGGGGSPRPSAQVREIDRVFANAAPVTGWGMTETNAIGAGIGGADYLARPLSSGQCSAVFDMRILDDEDREKARGETGHLVIRGTAMFREYWNRPDANSAAFVDGWFRTGDIARIDEEGFLFIVDRAKDIVIRGGENVGCGEVEDAIHSHPAVREVVVFGLPHERLGEEVAAMIVPQAGAELEAADIQAHLHGHLADFQVPSRILFDSEPLPRIGSGKFDKRGVRQAVMSRLGLTEQV